MKKGMSRGLVILFVIVGVLVVAGAVGYIFFREPIMGVFGGGKSVLIVELVQIVDGKKTLVNGMNIGVWNENKLQDTPMTAITDVDGKAFFQMLPGKYYLVLNPDLLSDPTTGMVVDVTGKLTEKMIYLE